VINEKDTKSIRRKIDVIEDDITNLYNYTETMSDFLVGDYKPPNDDFNKIYKIQMNLKKELSDFKNESLRVQMDLRKELSDFKNESLRVQMDLRKELSDFKNESLRVQMDLRKLMIRKTAIEFLNKIGFNQNEWQSKMRISRHISLNEEECFKNKFIEINFNEIYEKLLKIDYDKFIVSFAYFSDNHIDNFKAHPIYKLINETLEFDYELLSDIPSGYGDLYYMIGQSGGLYYKPNFINKYPYKQWCRYPTYETSYARQIDKDVLLKVYDEFEYISRIVSFTSIPPQRFL
jgi:hypothetical protein